MDKNLTRDDDIEHDKHRRESLTLEDIRPDLFDNRPSTYVEEGHNKRKEDR